MPSILKIKNVFLTIISSYAVGTSTSLQWKKENNRWKKEHTMKICQTWWPHSLFFPQFLSLGQITSYNLLLRHPGQQQQEIPPGFPPAVIAWWQCPILPRDQYHAPALHLRLLYELQFEAGTTILRNVPSRTALYFSDISWKINVIAIY